VFPDGESVQHTITEIAELGVLLLMFSAGLEIDLNGLAKVGRTAVVTGVSADPHNGTNRAAVWAGSQYPHPHFGGSR